MKTFHFFAVVCAVFLISIAGWIYMKRASPNTLTISETAFPSLTLSTTTNNAAPASQEKEVPKGAVEYRSEKYRFSLLYPSFLSVKEHDEEGGAYTISFESLEHSRGFQIFITPYADNQVTEDRFRQDNPSGVRKNLKDITVAGAIGAAFYSNSPLLGETREVWFIRNGYLYEVTTFKELDGWLSTIMQSWQFI